MRIAQVAPLHESVPPKLYGGTERVVSWLTEELVRRGHEVVLYASGDSETGAELRPAGERALRLDPRAIDPLAAHTAMLGRVVREAGEFDVIHFHTDFLHFPLARLLGRPHLTTLHGRLDLPEVAAVFAEFTDIPVVSISDSQRHPVRRANWLATVHHGLPRSLLPFRPHPEGYLAFLGRFTPEKRAEWAIEIARRAGMEIRLAAKIDPLHQAYFDERIRPLLRLPGVEYVGEVDERGKAELLGGAAALLFPIDWPEPFGLVMIEAMACGTPVIALRRGSVPEVMEDGVTGFVVDSLEEATAACARLDEIDRVACRRVFERRFSVERMADDYERLYRRLAGLDTAGRLAV
ncbi:glycosyltransferase family 4 protein [Inmirania thermothiophila]|uniref:Glycosyltransferase involved in cell wall biosynthesis n=1 Tax=Inmirania thermothiophila TaxID=1750597 RepID=A0A3N1Y1U3_9GAMM|nr:glycosyltransferase family 4 protein [Inmirania thermothiophila]ROR32796.1 glycosyltransferase involved in cell wall biosynthesis [Inmirania thermothiophila]